MHCRTAACVLLPVYFCLSINEVCSVRLIYLFPLQDGEVSCFRDIKPGAPHHYLVVPTKHVGNCKSLSKEDVPLGKVQTVQL